MADLQNIRTGLLGAVQGTQSGTFIAYSGYCVMGHLPLTRTTGSGFWSVRTGSGSGAFIHIGAGACVDADAGNDNKHPSFEVEVQVWLGVPKDTANNLSGVVVFIEAVRAALDNVLVEGGTTYGPPDVLFAGDVALLHYTMSCIGRGCG
jgi:hypothetical protein